jgi:hypothetical protein
VHRAALHSRLLELSVQGGSGASSGAGPSGVARQHPEDAKVRMSLQ